jgi:glucokinase
VIQAFLGSVQVDAACVAVAGTVQGRSAKLTHHTWVFDGPALEARLHCPVRLVNDFQAATRGVVELAPGDHKVLSGPAPVPEACVVALGPGTGLGVGFMVPSPLGWQVKATEGGHQDLAPNNPWEADLWAWLRAEHGHVSWERVLSGPGLVALHDFATSRGLAGLADPTPQAVGSGSAPACKEARTRFAHLLGHFAGNCALAHLPLGGVWICGGITPRLSNPGFDACLVQAFLAKGRFEPVLMRIPVALVTAPDLGLRGALAFARGLLRPP